MFSMQYSFTFPADYDMTIVRTRARTKGPLTDGFPRLTFKAYLLADRADPRYFTNENLYAPFYLWDNPEGMSGFLESPGFAGLSASFGWPSVKNWTVWGFRTGDQLAEARWATRETAPIPPYTDLKALRASESAGTPEKALGSVTGYEPATWTLVRFRLWAGDIPPADAPGVQIYEVGHVSLPLPTSADSPKLVE